MRLPAPAQSPYVLMAFLACTGAARAQPSYVRVVNAAAPAGGNGQAWASAYRDLQAALDDAAAHPAVTEVWVAAGAYAPTHPVSADPRSATFGMINGVGVYGGFAGGELDRGARDPVAHATILSGGPLPVGPANVYHVVTATGADPTAVLDGFTITGGYADPAAVSDLHGGGILADPGSPTLRALTITGNSADSGGGAYLNGVANMSDCSVTGNDVALYTAAQGFSLGLGGGLYLAGGPTLTRVAMTGNTAWSGGGAYISGTAALSGCQITSNHLGDMFGGTLGAGVCLSGAPVFTDCTIAGNSGSTFTVGGGIYGSGRFTRCSITGNSADGGSAIEGGGTFTSCQFSNNHPGGDATGGAMLLLGAATLVRCTISGNSAGAQGACVQGGSFESCAFSGNTASSTGAIVSGGPFVNCIFTGHSYGSFQPPAALMGGPFINCTFTGNIVGGPALLVSGIIRNCIVWGNASSRAQPYSGTISSSTLQGWDGTLGGAGNNGLDPLLASYRLQAGSPCIDSGDNSAVPPGVFSDADGRLRFFDAPEPDTGYGGAPLVDRGAFEYGAPPLCYANCDNSATAPVLNVNDFNCFLNRFAAGHPLANCDASSSPPVLNVNDFVCFLNAFAAGCS